MNTNTDIPVQGRLSDLGKPVLITNSPVMQDLHKKIQLISKTNASVIITGENGTGKEVFAQLLHYYSKRSDKPMITVNCGAIPSELVESELLGHEKGAFTGAVSQKKGCFELAHNSTLFLDEIGEMPLAAQVKLLRAVELGAFRRVGGREEVKVNVSLVSATNKILADQIEAGSFREDLFYRLNVVELYIPPLRHRREDIPLLIEFYKNYFSDIYNVPDVRFSDECIEMMTAHEWKGNVRELKNSIERCIILSEEGQITPCALPPSISKKSASKSFDSSQYLRIPVGTKLQEIEKMAITQTLESVDNNKTEAAKLLGFARKTLHNKLDRYQSEE